MVCQETEKCFQKLNNALGGLLPHDCGIDHAIGMAVLGNMDINNIFNSLNDHNLERSVTDNHTIILIKQLHCVIVKFVSITWPRVTMPKLMVKRSEKSCQDWFCSKTSDSPVFVSKIKKKFNFTNYTFHRKLSLSVKCLFSGVTETSCACVYFRYWGALQSYCASFLAGSWLQCISKLFFLLM